LVALLPTVFFADVRLDLACRQRAVLGHGSDDVCSQLLFLLDDLGAPPPVRVLAHPPAQQRPVVDGHQRGLVRPVFDQQPGRTCGVTPRGPLQNLPVVRAQPAEHRRVVRTHRY
jgi:hypothetical protein